MVNPYSWESRARLYNIVNTMAADELVTQTSKSLAAKVLS